jgi:hypothetical protein
VQSTQCCGVICVASVELLTAQCYCGMAVACLHAACSVCCGADWLTALSTCVACDYDVVTGAHTRVSGMQGVIPRQVLRHEA